MAFASVVKTKVASQPGPSLEVTRREEVPEERILTVLREKFKFSRYVAQFRYRRCIVALSVNQVPDMSVLHSSFRGKQKEVVKAVLAGKRLCLHHFLCLFYLISAGV